MPHIPIIMSSIKRARQTIRREERNKAAKSAMRTYVRRFEAAETLQEREAAFRQAASALDRAANRGIIHPNKAARTKSRLAKKMSASA